MYIFGYILIALAKVIGLIVNLYTFIVIAAALVSWVSPDPSNPIVRLLYGLTQPVFWRVRRFLPRPLQHLGVAISPIIVLILLVIVETILTGTLMRAGMGMMQER